MKLAKDVAPKGSDRYRNVKPKRVEKKVAFGAYPDVNLKDARRLRAADRGA